MSRMWPRWPISSRAAPTGPGATHCYKSAPAVPWAVEHNGAGCGYGRDMSEAPHLLVVDDHREIRDALAKYLARHDYRVSTAERAAAARRILEAGAIDLVVLDLMMPREDGLSLCRQLRAKGDLPIIMLTAMAEE